MTGYQTYVYMSPHNAAVFPDSFTKYLSGFSYLKKYYGGKGQTR